MICEIVTFPAPAGANREAIVEDARHVVAGGKGIGTQTLRVE